MSSPRYSTSSSKSERTSLTIHSQKKKEKRSSASSNSSKALADLYRSYDGPSDPNCETKQYKQSITSNSISNQSNQYKRSSSLSNQSVNKDCVCPKLTPEQRIAALESALSEAYGGLKLKNLLIKLQKTKLEKLHEIVETSGKANENLTYINQRLTDDLNYLKNLVKQYEGKYGKINDEEYEFYTAAMPTSLDTVKGLLLNQNEKLENIFKSLENAKESTGNEHSKCSDKLREENAILVSTTEGFLMEIEDLRLQLRTLRTAAFASRELIDEITDKSEAYVNAMRSCNASDTSGRIRISITPEIHDIESDEDNLLISSYEDFIQESSEKLSHLREIISNVYEEKPLEELQAATIKFKSVNSIVGETIFEEEEDGREENEEGLEEKEEEIEAKEEGIEEKKGIEETEEGFEKNVKEEIEEKKEEIEEKKKEIGEKKEEIEEKKEEIEEKTGEIEIAENKEEMEKKKEELEEKDAKIQEKKDENEEEKVEVIEEKVEAIEEKVEAIEEKVEAIEEGKEQEKKEEKTEEKIKVKEEQIEIKENNKEKIESKKENAEKKEESKGKKETKEEKKEEKETKETIDKRVRKVKEEEEEEEPINDFAAKIQSIEKVPTKVNPYKLTINNPIGPPRPTRANNEVEDIKSQMLFEIENMKKMSDKLSESLEKERKDWAAKEQEYEKIKKNYEAKEKEIQRERNESDAVNLHLRKENDDLNTRIEKIRSRFVEEIAEYKENLEEANEIIENLHQQLTSCKTNTTLEIRNLNVLLLEKDERLEQIELNYSKCKEECFAKEAHVKALVDFPEKLKKAEIEAEVLSEQCSDLSGKLHVLLHNLEDAVKERDFLQSKLEEIMCDYDKDKAEINKLTVLKESLTAKVESFEQKIADLTSLNESLKESYDKSVEEIEKLKYDAVTDMNKLKEEIDVLKETHKEAYRKLQDANGLLKATVNEKIEKLERLQRNENIDNKINKNENINKSDIIYKNEKISKNEKIYKNKKNEKHDEMRHTEKIEKKERHDEMRHVEKENIDIKFLPEYKTDRVHKTDLEKIMRECSDYRNKLDYISLKIDKHVKEHTLYKYETEQKLKQLLLENKFLYQKIEKEACPLLIFKCCANDVNLQINELQKFILSAGVHIQEVDIAKMKAVEILDKLKFTKNSVCQFICNYDTVNASTSLEKNGQVNVVNKLEIPHIRSNEELGQKVQEIRDRKNAAMAKQINQEIIDIKREIKRDVSNNINKKIISECCCTENKRNQ